MEKSLQKVLSKKENSNIARIKSLESKEKLAKEEASFIKKSLTGEISNKKVVFQSDDESDSGLTDKNAKLQLFKDDSESDSDNEDRFNSKLQFEGKEGEKLFKLQKGLNDKRFKMDERFKIEYESNDEAFDGSLISNNIKNIDTEDSEIIQEKQRAMEILNSIVKLKPQKRKQRNFRDLESLRYDPKAIGHEKFEVQDNFTEKSSILNKSTKLKLNQTVDDDQATIIINKAPIIVSKERFSEVSSTLTGAFNRNNQFKLTSLFDNDDDDEEGILQEDDLNQERISSQFSKKINDVSNNFLNFINSTEKDEDEEEEDYLNDSSREDKLNTKNECEIKNLNFFYDDNDERFNDDDFCTIQDESVLRKAWTEKRQQFVDAYKNRKKKSSSKYQESSNYRYC